MDYNAHLEGMSLKDVFQILCVGKMTGVATVIHDGHSGRIVFKDGNVVYASSDTQSRLGYTLVERGVISENDLAIALRDQRESEESVPLATMLVARGYVDSAVLERHTEEHIKRVFNDVLGWGGGMVHFKPQELPERSTVLNEGLCTEALLLGAAVAEDEAVGLDCELCEFASGES